MLVRRGPRIGRRFKPVNAAHSFHRQGSIDSGFLTTLFQSNLSVQIDMSGSSTIQTDQSRLVLEDGAGTNRWPLPAPCSLPLFLPERTGNDDFVVKTLCGTTQTMLFGPASAGQAWPTTAARRANDFVESTLVSFEHYAGNCNQFLNLNSGFPRGIKLNKRLVM